MAMTVKEMGAGDLHRRPLFIFGVNCVTENPLPASLHGVMTYVDAVKRFIGAARQPA
jgi:hypothetical protein